MMTETKCEPEHFQGRLIFMSMYSDMAWGENMNSYSRTDIGHFLDVDQKRNGTEPTCTSRMENGIASLRTW